MGSAASDTVSESSRSHQKREKENQQNRYKRNGQFEGDEKERALRLHTADCDCLYRWTMWRIYINEEMSRVVTHQPETWTKKNPLSTSSVTSSYLCHPDCAKHGQRLKRHFYLNSDDSRDIKYNGIPGNMYLVYGIPRVSLSKPVPREVSELHNSCQHIERYNPNKVATNGGHTFFDNTADHVSELFDFKSGGDNSTTLVRRTQQDVSSVVPAVSHPIRSTRSRRSGASDDRRGVLEEPLVSKSRKFWKSLAGRKTEIIRMGKMTRTSTPPISTTTQAQSHNAVFLENRDIRETRQLSISKETRSRQLWKGLADRKAEIVKLNRPYKNWDGNEPIFHKSEPDHNDSTQTNKQVSRRTSFLWRFLASKKRELLHMKKTNKNKDSSSESDIISANKPTSEKSSVFRGNDNASPSAAVSTSFDNPFQRELAEKLRRRRERQTAVNSNGVSASLDRN